jgi:hypothetical protein
MRSGNLSRYSPIGFSSRNIIHLLSLEELLINAGPKIFAARIGLVFSVIILLATLIGLITTALVFATILGIFSFLEAAFGICVACKLYPYVYKVLYQ